MNLSNISSLLAVLNTQSQAVTACKIIEDARRKCTIYQELKAKDSIRTLLSTSHNDFLKSLSDIELLIGLVKNARGSYLEQKRTIDLLEKSLSKVKETPNAGKLDDPKAAEASIQATRKLMGNGKLILLHAADNLVGLQKNAIENIINYGPGFYLSLFKSDKHFNSVSEQIFASLDVIEASTIFQKYENGFNQKLNSIYVSSLNRNTELATGYRNVMIWSSQNIEPLCRLQATVLLSIELSERHSKEDAQEKLRSLALKINLLMRKVVASSLSSTVCLLSLNKLTLNKSIFFANQGVQTTPFTGRLHEGKKSTIDRLRRLPDGMFVCMEGFLHNLKEIKVGTVTGFVGVLSDKVGDNTITIAGQGNIVTSGLSNGCYIRISANFRKQGGKLVNHEHLEIEQLPIKELYSRDIWKIAFWDICFEYFTIWANYLHVNTFATETIKAPTGQTRGPSPSSGPCEDKYQASLHAAQQIDICESDIISANINCLGATIAMLIACLGDIPTFGAATAACAAAIAWDLKALNDYNTALLKLHMAEVDYAAKHKAWLDCLDLQRPGLGYGGLSEGIPEWILDFPEEGDGDSGDTGGDSGGENPDPSGDSGGGPLAGGDSLSGHSGTV